MHIRKMAICVVGILAIAVGFAKVSSAKAHPHYVKDDAGICYELDDNSTGYTVYGWKGSATEIKIPDTLYGLPVDGIINDVFKGNKTLRKIIFSKNITCIQWESFAGCSNLEEVDFGSGIKILEHGAFQGCTKLSKLVSTSQIQNIGIEAFAECKALKEITLSKNLKEVQFNAFLNCTNLNKVTFEMKAKALSTVSLQAFKGSQWYQRCINQKQSVIRNGVLLYAGQSKAKITLSGKKLKGISSDAFVGNTDVKTIMVQNVKYINKYAFFNCKAKCITIKGNGTLNGLSLGEEAKVEKLTLDVKRIINLEDCSSVREIVFGKQITTFQIDEYHSNYSSEQLHTLKFLTSKKVEFSPSLSEFPNMSPYAGKKLGKLRHIYLKAKKPSDSIKKQFSKKVTLHVPKASKKIYKKYAKCRVL